MNEKRHLMKQADKILDEYNAGKLNKAQLALALKPVSFILQREALV